MAAMPADVAAQWVGIVASLCSTQSKAPILAAASPTGAEMRATGEMPQWARGGVDKRAVLHWDASQTVANVLINDKVALAVVDTGSYKTIMDIGSARMLGLPIREAR